MGLNESLIFYAMIGLAVAVAVWSQEQESAQPGRYFRAVTSVLFWPIYLPILLSPHPVDESISTAESEVSSSPDGLTFRIEAVKNELNDALASLDGWTAGALNHEQGRFEELLAAWNAQALRIQQLDTVLARCSRHATDVRNVKDCQSAQQFEQARLQNLAHLAAVRNQSEQELTTSLSRVRELISLIYVARFTGTLASRADDLILEIAASVEGLHEVAAWTDPCFASPEISQHQGREQSFE